MKSTWFALCVLAALVFLLAVPLPAGNPEKVATTRVDPIRGKAPGEVRDDNGLKMKLVWCPPGSVTMTSYEQITEMIVAEKVEDPTDDDFDPPAPEAVPVPRVTTKVTSVKAFLTKGYWIGQFEVTQAEWRQVMGTTPWDGRQFTKAGDNIPATWVNWDDSMEFCRKLTERERTSGRLPAGWEYRLPTEAQWERACRARTDTVFSFGDEMTKLGEYGWYNDNAMAIGESFAHPVGAKKPNPWGLYDVHGNVFEWCRDVHAHNPPGGRDPETTGDGPLRIFRGGSWCVHGSYCRSSDRRWPPVNRDYVALGVGLRVALVAVDRPK